MTDNLEIQQIMDIYHSVKRNTIMALKLKGLSIREIVRRLGGSTEAVVLKIIKSEEKNEQK